MVAENRPRLVKKPYLQSADDANPDHIALDKTVIRTNGEQFWLYAAVDSDTNNFLHVRLFTTITTASTQQFCGSFNRNTTLKPPCFSSIMLSISRRHSVE